MQIMPFQVSNSAAIQPPQRTMGNRWASISAIVSIVSLLLPTAPASANLGFLIFGNQNVDVGDYQRCALALTNLQVAPDQAASACANSLKPQDLTVCVNRLTSGGSIAATEAVSACRQVRRPVELGMCVVNIRQGLSAATASDVLNNCRRSLLPERYASCVVGLSRSIKLEPVQALNTCIDAGDFPTELDATFIPLTGSQGQPSDSLTVPSTPPSPSSPTAP